jgi:hypothetical protein
MTTDTITQPPVAAPAKIEAKPEAKPVQLRQTHQGRFKLGGHYTQDWEVCVEPGTTLDDLLKPEFFCHVAKQLRTFSKIRVLPDDASWYAELIVRSAGTNWARCSLFKFVEFDAVQPEAQAVEYAKVGWGGPSQKHRVVRISDGAVLSKDHESSEIAQAWLKDHLKALGR